MSRPERFRMHLYFPFKETLSSFLFLFAFVVSSGTADARLNLPQTQAQVTLPKTTRKALEAVLSQTASPSGMASLPGETAAMLLQGLPIDFRNSCEEMVGYWFEEAEARKTARWTVRVLHVLRDAGPLRAVLAFRCWSNSTVYRTGYDERPAVLSFRPDSAALAFVPLAKDCHNCSDLYHLELSQTFASEGSSLVELRVSHSTDNPCCDGGDRESGEQLLFLLLPEGQPVLTVDQLHEWDNHDDVDGDTQTICRAKMNYARDAAGNLQGVRTETRCTENGKPKAGIKKQNFHWSRAARRFEKVN